MPASSLSYNNINSDSRMIPDIMRVFAYARTRFPYGRNNRKKFVHQKRALQAFTDKSLKIAVFGSILNGVDDDFSTPFFCIHKISSQCYKMKLYQHSCIYHSHLRFRLTLRDIHR